MKSHVNIREVIVEASAKQRRFLEAGLCENPHDIRIGFGGARGAGKSHVTAQLHVLATAKYPGLTTIILRRGTQSAVDNYRDVISEVTGQFGMQKAYQWLTGRNRFRIANGSEIQLGFIAKDADYKKYVGLEYGLISISEANEHEDNRWDNLAGSNRAGRSTYVPRMTLDCNPGGIGNQWIKERFVNPKTRRNRHLWIPAFIWDCPMTILRNPNYINENLATLPEWQRRMWLHGDFDAMSGQYFAVKPENIRRTVKYGTAEDPETEIEIPPYANFWAGVDYGDAKPFAVIYAARWRDIWTGVDHMHVFSELYEAHLDLDIQAMRVSEQEDILRARGILTDGVVYFADPHTSDKTENVSTDVGRSVGRTWALYGFNTRPARSNNRIAGWKLIKMLLRHNVVTIDPECIALLGEMNTAQPEGWPGPPKSEDIEQGTNIKDHAIDACLGTGTIIKTSRGDVPIEDVTTQDHVLTRYGYKRVLDAGMTNPDAELLEMKLSNGTSLTGTANHPVFIAGRGFTPIGTIRCGEVLYGISEHLREGNLWQSARRSYTTESISGGIQTLRTGLTGTTTDPIQDTFGTGWVRSMWRYGKRTMGQFLKAVISTIRTAIRRITTRITSNACLQESIGKSIGHLKRPSGAGKWQRSEDRSQRLGTLPLKASNGIVNTLLNPALGSRPMGYAHANIAGGSSKQRHSTPNSAPIIASQPQGAGQASMMKTGTASYAENNSESTDTARRRPAKVVVLELLSAGRGPVYNITVEGQPEYFANGVLVHNCRYLAISTFGAGYQIEVQDPLVMPKKKVIA